jgi:hypothetical protein
MLLEVKVYGRNEEGMLAKRIGAPGSISTGLRWRGREDSNPQPSGPKPDALSIELLPQMRCNQYTKREKLRQGERVDTST